MAASYCLVAMAMYKPDEFVNFFHKIARSVSSIIYNGNTLQSNSILIGKTLEVLNSLQEHEKIIAVSQVMGPMGVSHDLRTLSHIIRAHKMHEGVDAGREKFEFVEANYPKLLANPKDKEDSIEFLVDGILIYGEQGKWSKVVSLSERMRDTAGSDGVIYNTAGRRFAFSYILAAYILENKSMAKEIFEDFCSTKMPSASWRFEEDTAAAVQDGEDLESENDGLSLSTSAFNNALDVLDAHGHLEEARETFGIMRELGVQFNVRTLAIFIQVYTILNPKTAKAAFEKMLQGGMIEKSSSNYKVTKFFCRGCLS